MPDDDRRLVYSTDGSLPLPPRAAKPAKGPAAASVPDDGIVRVGCERRRGGKREEDAAEHQPRAESCSKTHRYSPSAGLGPGSMRGG